MKSDNSQKINWKKDIKVNNNTAFSLSALLEHLNVKIATRRAAIKVSQFSAIKIRKLQQIEIMIARLIGK